MMILSTTMMMMMMMMMMVMMIMMMVVEVVVVVVVVVVVMVVVVNRHIEGNTVFCKFIGTVYNTPSPKWSGLKNNITVEELPQIFI